MSPPLNIPGIEIGSELGRGAYSAVFRARLGSTACALKVPHSRGRWTRWAYREAVALARVRHPGLPRVLEVGEVDGLPYILMELIEGETLAQRLRGGPLHAERAIEIAWRLAETLRAVHDGGLVHRDVKPRNIILESSGSVRLVDFGFAAPIGSPAARDAAGTRSYSAPEQFRNPERVDARADLYALGRVLVECLSGRPSDQDSTRIVVELTGSGIHPTIARIVHDLVAENPDDRYPDAAALLAELHRLRGGQAPRGASAYEPTRPDGSLVGRSTELERFVRTWRDVGAEKGRAFLVEGLPGSGKTRFVRACVAHIRSEGRGRSLEAACRDGDAPLAAVRRLVDHFLASLDRTAPQERAALSAALRASASGPIGALAHTITPRFAEALGMDIPPSAAPPEAFAEGAAEFIVRMARHAGPFVVLVDDFQWVDPLSREVIAALADRAQEAPILLVAAARSSGASRPFARFDNLESLRAIKVSLGPLELRQSAELIASNLGIASVHPIVVRRVVAMADNTPVGVLEVLGAFLDAGALRLRADTWELNEENLAKVSLPAGALAYLGRRAAELVGPVRRVLEVAAILGTRFEHTLLARVAGLDLHTVEQALGAAKRAGLVDEVERRVHVFGHETVRELLVRALDEGDRRQLHRRAAEILAEDLSPDLENLYACARHFEAAQTNVNAALAHRAVRKAAETALERFDNETALRFFDLARTWAEKAGLSLDAQFYRRVGEAHLRIGLLEDSLRSFEIALGLAEPGAGRAAVLSRIAWVQRARSQPELAWKAIDEAFAMLGVPIDEGKPPHRPPRRQAASAPEALEVLYDLHHQNARLGVECGKPLRTIASSVQVLGMARGAGPSIALARAQATYGAVLALTGKRTAGSRRLGSAQAMATKLGDTATIAFCLQRRALAHAFMGDFEGALRLLRECADDYGPWFEVNEYCATMLTGDFLESVRGRASEGWKWIGRARDRLRRRPSTTAAFAHNFAYRSRAAIATLAKTGQDDPWLLGQIDALRKGDPERLFSQVVCWGPRARYLLDSGDLGSSFEDLVHEFRTKGGIDPASAHPIVIEYYIVVAHARIHQCLRASADERSSWLPRLRQAAADLRASARLPAYRCHSLYADGCLAWLEGAPAKARRFFAEAEGLAMRESCPWVLYGVARARAHILREGGNYDAARDMARVAEVLALAHEAEPRARCIREEFGLPAPDNGPNRPSMASSAHRSSRRVRRQLVSLLHIVRAPYNQLQPAHQGTAVVDDLVRELAVERAFLLFDPPDRPGTKLLVGRNRLGETLPVSEEWRNILLRRVRESGESWDLGAESDVLPKVPTDRNRLLVVPLSLHDTPVGAVCVERAPFDPAFTIDDQELLLVLCHQVPLALELPRLLAERDQLHASIQQVQKMEVVGQLAGSVAHDFNNMLQAIEISLDVLDQNGSLDEDAREETQQIHDAMRRASYLTSKLLAFSRQQPLPLASTPINSAIKAVAPLIQRLTTKTARVNLVLDLAPDAHAVMTDEISFEQAIVNLAVNARDAMPQGGSLRIATRNVTLGDEAVRRGAPAVGDYVAIEVADSGQGMPPEVLARVFDPFFTTKPVGKGTGLGLTTVYTFVKKCGGHIDVASQVGRGTTFCIYLPRADAIRIEIAAPMLPAPSAPPGSTPALILVVDDDPILCEATRAQLQDGGYRVMTASGSAEALRFVERSGSDIGLVILDVNMPEMSGPELRQRLDDLHVRAKVLFVSGHARESLPDLSADRLLTKPFSRNDLLGSVRNLLS